MKAVEQAAMEQGCTSISLITTNDNLHALKFYQKRGYCLIEILRNAVEKQEPISLLSHSLVMMVFQYEMNYGYKTT